MSERSDLDILADLGVEPVQKAKTAISPREARIIAGFEDIQKFVEEHGRPPQHGEDRDIFERLYAVRLDRLRAQPECVEFLRDLDHQALLETAGIEEGPALSAIDDAALLAALGAESDPSSGIGELRHVRPASERRAAEDIAVRHPCPDFETFAPVFAAVKADLAGDVRQTRRFERKSEIEQGRFFIVDGLLAYVAEAGEIFTNESGNRDRRLRVIYDNGTENNLLARSLQKALTQDPTGRRITEPAAGPLFNEKTEVEGSETGTIYVLRSQSDHPEIARNRNVIHKIGVTGGDVDQRIVAAEKDPTFLMAPVEIVATFRLFDIRRTALENLLHRFFAPAEWFFVPLPAIRDAVARIQDGSLHRYEYRPDQAALVRRP